MYRERIGLTSSKLITRFPRRGNPTVQQSAETETVPIGASGNPAAATHVDAGGSGGPTDWATLASTPYQGGNRFAVLSTDDDDQREQNGDDQPFTTVRRRNTKRLRQRATPPSPQQQQQQQRSTTEQPNRQRRAPTVFGTASTAGGNKIVAAKKLCKKAVFCIDNMSKSCTVSDIETFVLGLSVDVLSCFEVKPRRRRHEKKVTDRKAFRLCINDSHRDRLLNAAVWPESITVAEWYFKPPGSNEDGKRRRLDDIPPENDEVRPMIGGMSTDAAADATATATDASSECTVAEDTDRTVEMTDDDTLLMENYNLQDGN